MEDYMTLSQLAARLGLRDTASLRRAIKSGYLAASLMGKTWIVEQGEAHRFERERPRPGRPSSADVTTLTPPEPRPRGRPRKPQAN